MDHWGDPWADNNADDTKPVTKHEVAPSSLTIHTTTSSLSNGFLEDAGWGNEEAVYGGWNNTSGRDDAISSTIESCSEDSSASFDHDERPETFTWETEKGTNDSIRHGLGGWNDVVPDDQHKHDYGRSETSDSSTTIQADDPVVPFSTDLPDQSTTDDDSSARSFTSPSETSHVEAPADSPRTSVEEDRHNDKVSNKELSSDTTNARTGENTTWAKDASEPAQLERKHSEYASHTIKEWYSEDNESESKPLWRTLALSRIETAHLDELFPDPQDLLEPPAVPDDPIYTTAGHKAWYRLTRKQTLREYSNGATDDNYIRVTWATSHIRADVSKIIGRWAREDRMSGNGAGARASFYWDTPASKDPLIMRKHSLTVGPVSEPTAIALARQSLPMPPGAAFIWSPSRLPPSPLHESSSSISEATSALSGQNDTTGKSSQEKQATSAIRILLPPPPRNISKPAPLNAEALKPQFLISPPVSSGAQIPTELWERLEDDASKPSPVMAESDSFVDDDDEWGEMVSTPILSMPTIENPPTQPNTFKSLATTSLLRASSLNSTLQGQKKVEVPVQALSITSLLRPSSINSTLPKQKEVEVPVHASSIVRLKRTVSPTTSSFTAKIYVPKSMESGPIGPGLLRSRDKSAYLTQERSRSMFQPVSMLELLSSKRDLDVGHDGASIKAGLLSPSNHSDGGSGFSDIVNTTPTTETTSKSPFASPLAEIAQFQSSSGSWTGADFSAYESIVPAKSAQSNNEKPRYASISYAQPKQDENDGVIKSIVGKLPNLEYMLVE